MQAMDLNRKLDELEDEYTYRVNALVAEGREDLAIALSVHYIEERDEIKRTAAA